MDARSSRYHEVYARWQRDPEGSWAEAANELDWFEKPAATFDPKAGIYGRWFPGGVSNTCYNALDRHVNAGRGDQVAIIYNSPLAGAKRTLTYHRLLTETQVLAAMLRDLGVEKGDRVILYMPMVPEAVIAMLACARIGADSFRRLRRLRCARTRHPDRRLQTESDFIGKLRHRARTHGALQTTPRRSHHACRHKPKACLSCNGRKRKRR